VLENVAKFRVVGTTVTNQSIKKLRAEAIKGMSGTVLFRIFCLPISCVRLYKRHKTITLPVFFIRV
jgi:hypothetical protein